MKKVILVPALLAVCAIARTVPAQEVALDKIVVTPNRNLQDESKVSGNVSVISSNQIQASEAKNIPELLNTQSGVMMRDYIGNGKTTNVDIRGFGEEGFANVLVLVDGRRVNNIDTTGVDWTQIPISMVERIEIERGTGSVLYGDNATGGVINIITKNPSTKPVVFNAGVLAGSYGTYKENTQVSFKKDRLSLLGSFEHYDSDGYRINSRLHRNDINGKLCYDITPTLTSFLSFGNHRDRYGLPNALRDIELNNLGPQASVTPDNFATTGDDFIDMGIAQDFDEFGKFEISVARRKRDTFADLVDNQWLTERNTDTHSANAKYTLENKLKEHDNILTSGFDFSDARQKITDGSASGNPDEIALTKKNYGFYLNDQFFITKKLSLTGGERYENVHYTFDQEAAAQETGSSKFQKSIGQLGLNYEYALDSHAYATFTQSFRQPFVDEIYTSKYDFPGYGSGGGLNPDLLPQTANTYETGIKHSFFKGTSLGASGYLIYVKNELYLDSTTYQNSNYPKTIHRGIEFRGDTAPLEWLKFFTCYSFTDAFFNGGPYDKRKIPAVPVHRWTAGADLRLRKYLTFAIVENYVGERYFISDEMNSFPRMAEYLVTDLKLTFAKNNYSFFVGLNNLFNEQYYEYGVVNVPLKVKNYYPSAGRNFAVGGTIQF